MQYLIRLVTPNGGTVLDPFNGSGSTGKATMHENVEHNKDYKYVGIELTEEYLPISKARIEWASVYHHTEEPIKVKEDNSGLQCETLW
jgi:site-specific DNA-methyltransferase (adenine-specific)